MYLCICIVAYCKHTYTRYVCLNVNGSKLQKKKKKKKTISMFVSSSLFTIFSNLSIRIRSFRMLICRGDEHRFPMWNEKLNG